MKYFTIIDEKVEPKGQISNTLQSDLKRLIRFIYKFNEYEL